MLQFSSTQSQPGQKKTITKTKNIVWMCLHYSCSLFYNFLFMGGHGPFHQNAHYGAYNINILYERFVFPFWPWYSLFVLVYGRIILTRALRTWKEFFSSKIFYEIGPKWWSSHAFTSRHQCWNIIKLICNISVQNCSIHYK